MRATEEWRDVKGWPLHAVSDLGRVRTYERKASSGRMVGGRLLQPDRGDDGRPYVTLKDGRRRRRAPVATLVLEAFDGPAPAGAGPLHRNGREWDNRRPNLRWGTPGKRPGELVSLADAHEDGMFGTLTLAAVRTARHRYGTFPEAVSARGTTSLYERAALAAWWAARPR